MWDFDISSPLLIERILPSPKNIADVTKASGKYYAWLQLLRFIHCSVLLNQIWASVYSTFVPLTRQGQSNLRFTIHDSRSRNHEPEITIRKSRGRYYDPEIAIWKSRNYDPEIDPEALK